MVAPLHAFIRGIVFNDDGSFRQVTGTGTGDEIIKAQDAHLKESVANADATHTAALDAMKGRWKHPIAGMRWYKKTKSDFAMLPEDSGLSGAVRP